MDLCYLYDTMKYNHVDNILNSFDKTVSLKLSDLKSLQICDIYIIELNEISKELSLQIKKLFEDKFRPLIYFIVPKSYTLMLFQLTYLLKAKDIIPNNQDPQRVIKKIISDRELHLEQTLEILLAKKSIKNTKIMFFENMQLRKVTPELLKVFKCRDSIEFQEKIVTQIDIKNLLNKDIETQKTINDLNNKEHSYNIESVSLPNNIKIVTFENAKVLEKNLAFIASRVTFIELLKDKYIQNSIVENRLSAMCINIKNLETIKESLTLIEFEYLLIDFLSYMESILEKKLIFAAIEKNFYIVLFENISDEERREIASNFNTKMLNYIAEQKNRPFLDIHTLSLTAVPFNEILSTLEKIFHQKTSYTEELSYKITHTSSTQNVISEKSLLDQTFQYNNSLRILNIYKGLVIKTRAKILKTTQESVYIQFEPLQGVVLNLEKETILQAPSFIQDIGAKVKLIDLHKKIAVLEKFKFLKTNPNARQYSRVTMANKTPVSVRFSGRSLNGFIIDISIKSIAINTKYNDQIKWIKGQTASLICNIPNTKLEDGYVSVTLHCTVIATTMQDTENSCKIICDLEEDTPDITHIVDYIYQRQKSLIIELKKSSNLL